MDKLWHEFLLIFSSCHNFLLLMLKMNSQIISCKCLVLKNFWSSISIPWTSIIKTIQNSWIEVFVKKLQVPYFSIKRTNLYDLDPSHMTITIRYTVRYSTFIAPLPKCLMTAYNTLMFCFNLWFCLLNNMTAPHHV